MPGRGLACPFPSAALSATHMSYRFDFSFKRKRPRFFKRGRLSHPLSLITSGDPAAYNRKNKHQNDKDKIVHLLLLPIG